MRACSVLTCGEQLPHYKTNTLKAIWPAWTSRSVNLWIPSSRVSTIASEFFVTALPARRESRRIFCCAMRCSRLGKWANQVHQAEGTGATSEIWKCRHDFKSGIRARLWSDAASRHSFKITDRLCTIGAPALVETRAFAEFEMTDSLSHVVANTRTEQSSACPFGCGQSVLQIR